MDPFNGSRGGSNSSGHCNSSRRPRRMQRRERRHERQANQMPCEQRARARQRESSSSSYALLDKVSSPHWRKFGTVEPTVGNTNWCSE